MFNVAKLVARGDSELQDRAEIFRRGSELIVVVADGAGGRSGGAQAAEFVMNQVGKEIASIDTSIEGLTGLLSKMDQLMVADKTCGETTCVIAAVSEDGISGASVGDSGAWVVSPSGIDNLTARQSRKPFIGTGMAMPLGFYRKSLEGVLLVATDGLLKYASADKIASVSGNSDLEQSAKNLVELVRYPSGVLPDDVTVVLVRRA